MVQNGRSARQPYNRPHMTRQVHNTFAALVLAQAAHSTEEYFGRRWEALLPPRIVSLVFSSNPQRGFLIANLAIVAFGLWTLAWPVRRGWRVAGALIWGWTAVEIANGILHPLATLALWRYVAGVATAPLLLVLALRLVRLLRDGSTRSEQRPA
jgi:hypothetical protein